MPYTKGATISRSTATNTDSYPIAIASLPILIMGVFPLARRARPAAAGPFFALCLAAAGWLAFPALSSLIPADIMRLLVGAEASGIPIVSVAFLLFSVSLAHPGLGRRLEPYAWILSAGLAVAAYFGLAPRAMTAAFLSISAFSLAAAMLTLLTTAFRRNAAEQLAVRAALLASTLVLVAVALPRAMGIDALTAAEPYMLILAAFLALSSVTSHRLAIRRTVIYSGILFIVLAVYSLAILVAAAIMGDKDPLDWRVLVANIMASFLISLGYGPISRWLRNATDRIFYRRDYVKQGLLGDLAHTLNDVLALDEALEVTMQGLVRTFRLKHAATYVFQNGEKGQVVVKRIRQIGYDTHARLMVEEEDYFTTFFAVRESILVVGTMKTDLKEFARTVRRDEKAGSPDAAKQKRILEIRSAVLRKLESLDVAVALPLRINQQPIGVILLSPTLSGEAFDQGDLDLMDLVGSQVTSAIQKARLYEGDQAKSEFVSIASHELLTPIAAMEGYLSMILEDSSGQTKIDGQAKGYLDKVYTSAKRLSTLVKDMLSASRIESGEMKIQPQQLDLGKIIRESFDQLKFTARDKKLDLVLEPISKGLPPVWADQDRTTQVLINLIGNAIKYTPSGSVRVKAVANPDERVVSVEISDTGVGMTEEQQAHLFEKFYRITTEQTAHTQGTGLGLYITKSIVEHMGGTISVSSRPGKGSTFSFSLPMFQAEASRA